jgi:hypothetical protein
MPASERWWTATVGREGSTRPLALLRIGLVLLLWAGWAPGLRWVRSSDPDFLLVSGLFFVSSGFVLAGLGTRFWMPTLAAACAAVFYYLGLAKEMRELFVHHNGYLLVVVAALLALSPCGRSLSLDRLLDVRRARRRGVPAPAERGPLWTQVLIAFQVSQVYFWGAFDKTTPHFLSGAALSGVFEQMHPTSTLPLADAYPLGMAVSSVAAVALEYALAAGLWIPRLRVGLICLGVAFHAALYYSFYVGIFSVEMMLLYVAFLPPESVHRVLDDLVLPASAPGKR